MTGEPPAKDGPSPPRRTEAASFRCRRRSFRRPLTVFLALLTAGTLWLYYQTAHTGHEGTYAWALNREVNESILILHRWDSAPMPLRWLSGWLSRETFYEYADGMVSAARRGGYLDDTGRIMMMLICLHFDRRDRAREWLDDVENQEVREANGAFYFGGTPREALARTIREEMESRAGIPGAAAYRGAAGDARNAPGSLDAEAERAFFASCRRTGIYLAIILCGLSAGISILRRSRPCKSATTNRRRLTTPWNGKTVFGAWLRAEWVFLLGGMMLIVLSALAWSFLESHPAAGLPTLRRAAEGWLEFQAGLSASPSKNVVYAALMLGPALLMIRWLTPGVHGALRVFGIRRCKLSGRDMVRATMGGLSLAMVLFAGSGALTFAAGWIDPRDAWSRDFGQQWEQILYGCFIAPIAEEFTYRGFFFTGLRRQWGPWFAALASSFLFAIMHGYSLPGTIEILLYGMLMCLLYQRTGTLVVPLAVHALTNAVLTLVV